MSPETIPVKKTSPDDEAFGSACGFLYSLVAAVQRYGVSSAAMESKLAKVAGSLGLRGQFLATPTKVESILWKDDENAQRLHVSVSNSGDYDLNKLVQVNELVGQVESGEVSPDAGEDRLREIDGAGPEYGPWVNVASFALCGVGFGLILGLPWLDVFLGGALSIVSFGVAGVVARWQGLTVALELLVAALVTILASLLALALPGLDTMGIVICAVIYYVPGFGLTLGANELMAGNTLSGLIGFTRAVVTAGKLVIGALIGVGISRYWADGLAPSAGAGLSNAWSWVGAPALVLGLAVLFRVRRKELIWPVLGGIFVWAGVQGGSGLGFWQGTAIGAFFLSVASQILEKRKHLPAEIIELPAVMVLVPGVAALRALYAAETEGVVQGLLGFMNVLVLIAAILGGLLLGQVVGSASQVAVSTVSPRRQEAAST